MRVLPKPIAFQWDMSNIHKNLIKHNVTTQEAEEIFVRKPFYIKQDVKHSSLSVQRFTGLGKTKSNRLLFVAFTIRDEKIRVISVRDMKRIERSNYEKT